MFSPVLFHIYRERIRLKIENAWKQSLFLTLLACFSGILGYNLAVEWVGGQASYTFQSIVRHLIYLTTWPVA